MAYTNPMIWAALSGTFGVEKTSVGNPHPNADGRLSIDLTGAVTPDPMLADNYQFNMGSEPHSDVTSNVNANGRLTGAASWMGFGLQPVVTMDAFKLGARFEFFQDKGFSRTGLGGVLGPQPIIDPATGMVTGVSPAVAKKVSLWNVSITPGYMLGGGFMARLEYRHDGVSEKVLWDGKKGQDSFSIGASYMF